MKKIVTTIIVLLISVISIARPNDNECIERRVDAEPVRIKEKCFNLKEAQGSVYTASANETDSRPYETFDQSIISPAKLNSGELRWVALSRDLLQEFTPGAPYKAGDTITIVCNKWRFSGKFIVKDTMNKRWKNKVDFLKPLHQFKMVTNKEGKIIRKDYKYITPERIYLQS